MESAGSASSPEPRMRSYTPSQSSQQSHAHGDSVAQVPLTSRHHSPPPSFSDPYLQGPVHLVPTAPRYPESAQRTLSHDHSDGRGYLPPTSAYHLSEQGPSRARYLPPEEGVAGPSGFYTPQVSPGPMGDHLPPMGPYQSEDTYRGSLRSYHTMHLNDLEYRRAAFQPPPLDDFRAQHPDAFYASDAHGAARQSAGAAGRLRHSPPRHAHSPMQDAHYRLRAPSPTHDSSPRHGAGYTSSAGVAHGHPPQALPAPSMHAPSSIPMCNPPDRIYYEHAPRHTNDSHFQLRHPTYPQHKHEHEHDPSESPFFQSGADAQAPYKRHFTRGRSLPEIMDPVSSTLSSGSPSPVQASDADLHFGGGSDGDAYERYMSGPASAGLRAPHVPEALPDADNDMAPPLKKKRKKSKMHECTVCGKKFPR
ncbi:hypothetical protein HYPSUDRAFT_602112 [Hypholoma sublateritium FD-334 SS-4]|uniref:Uncharacterized protein n=1 Tax=Hypholoma sublateritium (strain FD-334 SS-4) TaxID=945553 RepID=A0A0D2PTY3_HYPSF|nr:hypothetical protein HYPSUDRAFT_602112 [Hypholoma sublateritium FD-334 SS-4]